LQLLKCDILVSKFAFKLTVYRYIQVYKMKDDRYMIDFQRMDGGVMTCMDAAAALMKNLRLT
jgi:hypothetical protein